jgi:hypothetical protein
MLGLSLFEWFVIGIVVYLLFRGPGPPWSHPSYNPPVTKPKPVFANNSGPYTPP